MRVLLFLGLWLLVSIPAVAQEPDSTAVSTLPRPAEITLVDGSSLVGHIINEAPDSLLT